MKFECTCCGEWHDGPMDMGFDAPVYWHQLPESDRPEAGELTDDFCRIEGDHFIRCVLEIPIIGETETFGWGVWMSVSDANYALYRETFQSGTQSVHGPFTGYLSNQLPGYPDTTRLIARAHLQDGNQRPTLELQPTDHPLSLDQRDGMSIEQVAEIVTSVLHPNGA